MKIKSLLKPSLKLNLKSAIVSLVSIIMVSFSNNLYATHAEGADITYKCLGGNQYEITLSFYRDCQGINAPTDPTVNCKSISLGENLVLKLVAISGKGQKIYTICVSLKTK